MYVDDHKTINGYHHNDFLAQITQKLIAKQEFPTL